MLSDALFDPQASFIVADDGEGNILGYAGLHVVLDEGYIAQYRRPPRRPAAWSGLRPAGCVLPLRRRQSGPSSLWRYGYPTLPPSAYMKSMASTRLACGRDTTKIRGRTP